MPYTQRSTAQHAPVRDVGSAPRSTREQRPPAGPARIEQAEGPARANTLLRPEGSMPDAMRATERIASIEAFAAGRPLLPIQEAIVFALRSASPELHRLVDDIDRAGDRGIQERWERVLEAEVFAERNPVKTKSELIESYVQTRRAIADEIRGIVREATDAKRAIGSSDESRIDELNDRYDRVTAEEARLRTTYRKLEPGDATYRRIQTAMNQPDNERPADPIRELFREGVPVRDFTPATTEQTRYLPDLDWNAEPGRMDNVIQMSARAISDFANASALFVNDFASRVAVYQRTLSPWMRLATVINADNGRPVVLPNLTADGTTYKPGEGTAITASDPTLGNVTLTPVSYKAMTYISWEAWEDQEVNLSDLVARSHARSIALSFGSDATTAILAAINNGGTATGLGGGGTATFLGYEDLIDLKYSRASNYRDGGSWIMANGAIKKARKWADKNGNYLWSQAASVAGQPDSLDGDSVYEDPYLAAPGSATKSVVYGDMSTLVIKAGALRAAVSTDFKFDTDQITVKTVQRLGIAVPDPTGVAYLVSATT